MVFAFDLDDTLYTEMDFVRSGYRAVSRELERTSTLDAESYYKGICARRPVGFEWALQQYFSHGGSDSLMSVDGMIEMYRAHTPDISLRPGAREALEDLKRAGHRLVLITDGSTRHQRSKIRALDIEKYFDDILISEEVGGDKTTDMPWSRVERSFGAPGQRFVYIGDNISKDFHLPGLRGWRTVMMRDREGVNVFPQKIVGVKAEYRPQIVVDEYSTLLNLK